MTALICLYTTTTHVCNVQCVWTRIASHAIPCHMTFTFCLSSSVRASMRTLAQGSSLGHHAGRVDSRPHPGLPRPVEYFSISGMKARNCACVIFSTGVGMPSMINGGNSNNDGSSWIGGGACCASADSNSSITILFKLRTTSSNGLAPNTL